MQIVDKLEVYLGGVKVGTMAPYQKYRTAFEYSEEWLREGFSLNPFSLPLQAGVMISKTIPFEGLFGVFADSLPDGWGRLLVDRMLRRLGERPEEIDALTRLAIVGNSGMGALEYRPVYSIKEGAPSADLDRIAEECKKILESEKTGDLDLLFAMGGSSGGARPKILTAIDGEEWIIKFPSSGDPADIGVMEYEYSLCAAECGIRVSEVKLFPSKNCAGYFGTKRFDREKTENGEKKIHMASASGLLEISHRVPSLDYSALMALTWQLTKKADELLKMYTLMCFNVFAHNRDDHSNNFTFLCDQGDWSLAPAYDLTYSNSLRGEHATTVAGEGKNPGRKELLAVAKKAGIKESAAKEIADRVETTVGKMLRRYLDGAHLN